MARTKHGNKLEAFILQPGSRFSRTESGFDTGSRTVKIDASKAYDMMPEKGASDYDIKYSDGTTISRGFHTHMFLKEAELTDETNGIATISMQFEGVILRKGQKFSQNVKAPYYTPGVRQLVDQLDGVNLDIFLQEITKTYLAADLRSLFPLNKIASPPFEGSDLSQIYNRGSAERLRLPDRHGWTITNRTYRLAGTLGGLAIYEVNDTYSEFATWII